MSDQLGHPGTTPAPGAPGPVPAGRVPPGDDWATRIRPFTGIAALVVLCVIFGSRERAFISQANFFNILDNWAIIGILALGQAFPLIGGGFDLSQGAVATFAGSVTAWLMSARGVPIPAAIAAGVALGALLGAVNGALITAGRINPFVATLGTKLVYFGLTAGIWDAQPLSLGPQSKVFQQLSYGKLGDFSIAAVIFLVLTALLWFCLRLLPFGQHVYALGGNEEATRLAGVHTARVKILVYTLSGFLAACGGMVLIARSGQASPTAGTDQEFLSMASCIIGGVALGGGVGGAGNVLLGVLTLGVIDTGLQMAIPLPNWRVMIQGAIILIAVAIDARARLRRA